jgi:hypothetical protein
MKSNLSTPIIEMDINHLRELTQEVKETLATDINLEKPVFSAADLWNIQKMRVMRRGRRVNL